jgi:hypothetical protein
LQRANAVNVGGGGEEYGFVLNKRTYDAKEQERIKKTKMT